MAENVEPWDKVGVNQQNVTSDRSFVSQMSSSLPQGNLTSMDGLMSQTRPLIPPRPPSAILPYNASCYPTIPYSNGYGNMGYYSNYPFGELNNYMGLQNSFGGSIVMQQAETTTRQAFQSVETFVRTFSSISMMMESTLQAVSNSFRAILGVIDHFSRMKIHMSQIYSTISIIRLLKWFIRKLKLYVRLVRIGWPQAKNEQIWEESENVVMNTGSSVIEEVPVFANLPIFLFFVVVLGAPWMLWKLASSTKRSQEKSDWKNGFGEHYKGVVEYDFTAQRSDELSLVRGTKLYIAPKGLQPPIRGWALVSPGDGRIGLVPQSYVKVIGRKDGQVSAQIEKSNTNARSHPDICGQDIKAKCGNKKVT